MPLVSWMGDRVRRSGVRKWPVVVAGPLAWLALTASSQAASTPSVAADPPPTVEPSAPSGGEEPIHEPPYDMTPPRLIKRVFPEYPDAARKAGIGGVVVLASTIDALGAVTHLKVLQSVPLLDAAAMAAVSQWRYRPARYHGKPVPVSLSISVGFDPRPAKKDAKKARSH